MKKKNTYADKISQGFREKRVLRGRLFILRIVIIFSLLIVISLQAPGQEPTSTKPELTFGEPTPQSFNVFAGNANESTINGGIIGGGGYYYAVVTISPRYEIPGDGTTRIVLDGNRVIKKEVQRKDPGGLALVTWSMDLMDMDSPAGLVKKVTAYFDNGTTAVSEQKGAGTYVFDIPGGASRLVRFEVNWAWGRNNHSLIFEARAGSSIGWMWPLIILALPILLWLIRRIFFVTPRQAAGEGKKKKEEKQKKECQCSLTINPFAPASKLFAFKGAGDINIVFNAAVNDNGSIAKCDVTIKDREKKLVNTYSINATLGVNNFTWNLYDSNKNFVEQGYYYFEICVTLSNGNNCCDKVKTTVMEHRIPEPTATQENSLDDCDADSVCKHGCTVLLHSGEERLDRVDLVIPGRGDLNFIMKRRYRSRLDYNGPLGFGWDFDYNDSLFPQSNGDVVRSNGRSHLDRWTRNPDGSFTAPKGHFRTLVQENSGRFILRSSDGFKRFYQPDGRLERYQDRFDNLMLFKYDPRGNLKLVIDPYGREIEFTYSASPDGLGGQVDRLAFIRDFAGREVRYTYDERGDLVEVCSPTITGTSTGNDFPKGRSERYTYSFGFAEPGLNHKILTLTSPEEAANEGPPTMSWTYGTDPNDPMTFGRVLTETVGGTSASNIPAGGTTTYVFERLNQNIPTGDPEIPRGKVTITEPNGNRHVYFGNENHDHILTHEMTRGLRPNEPPFYETRFFYNDEGLKVREVFPAGNEARWTYDNSSVRGGQRNLVEIRKIADAARGGGEDIVVSMTYEPLFNQIASITGPRGHANNFTPPLGTASADRYTTRFFYDYQEGSAPIPDVILFGIDISGASRGLGDLNGNGRTDKAAGSLVRAAGPAVELLPGSNEAARSGGTTQVNVLQYQWNDRGQVTAKIDQEGNATEYEYYPENNPGGDGNVTSTYYLPLTNSPTGYLRAVILDSKTSPRRSSTNSPVSLKTVYGRDQFGNIVSILNPRGVLTTIEVNRLNEPVVITRGAKVEDAANSGQLITGEDPFRYQTRFYYDYNGRVIKTQVENRDQITVGVSAFIEDRTVYDILGNVVEKIREVDSHRHLGTLYRFDETGLLISKTMPEGNRVQTTYDERNLPFTITRGYDTAEAATTQFDYDLNGNLCCITDAEDKDLDGEREQTHILCDGFDRTKEVIDALGNKTITSYDVISNVIAVEETGHPAGKPGDPAVRLSKTIYHYDEQNRNYQIDRYLFLSDGFNPQRPVDLRGEAPVGRTGDKVVSTRMEYDALSRLTHTVMPDKEVTKTIYDGAGRVVETVDALGNKQLFVYDNNSNAIQVDTLEISPDNIVPGEKFTAQYVYDQLDRLVRITDNAGQTSRLAYDSRDNLIQQSDPEGPVAADPLGLYPKPHQKGKINEAGNTTHFAYDGLGRLIKEVHDLREGGVGGNPLDISNSHNPTGKIMLRFTWDDNSRLSGITDNNGNVTTFNYDALNRKTGHIFADGKQIRLQYDRDDNLLTTVDPNGTVSNRQYDAISRLIRTAVDRAAGVCGTTEETYTYDGKSRLIRSTDDNGNPTVLPQTCERVYDSLSNLLEERQNGQVISYLCNIDGTRHSCTYPGGRNLFYKHDEINRIKSIHDANGVITEAFYIGPGYRELKRVNKNGTQLSFLNDTGDKADGYSVVQQITRLRCFLPDGVTAFLDREYSYNRAGQRTSEKRNDDFGLTDIYYYDSLYRITKTKLDQRGIEGALPRDLQEIDYLLDGVGNRKSVKQTSQETRQRISYEVNQLNRYTLIGDTPRVHDNNGNLIDDGEKTFAYDSKNRLTGVYAKNEVIATYLYDTENRRTQKKIYSRGTPGEVKEQTDFFYDGWQVCEEQNAAAETKVTYIYSPVYIDEPVQIDRTGHHSLGKGTLYTHQNARADVVAVTDETGEVVERRFYDDFGQGYDENKQKVKESDVGNPYGFQGRRLDPETGLYYFRNRYYEPVKGRFIQRDPVWDPTNVGNLYTFVGGNTVSRSDVLGLSDDDRPPPGRSSVELLRPPPDMVKAAPKETIDLSLKPTLLPPLSTGFNLDAVTFDAKIPRPASIHNILLGAARHLLKPKKDPGFEAGTDAANAADKARQAQEKLEQKRWEALRKERHVGKVDRDFALDICKDLGKEAWNEGWGSTDKKPFGSNVLPENLFWLGTATGAVGGYIVYRGPKVALEEAKIAATGLRLSYSQEIWDLAKAEVTYKANRFDHRYFETSLTLEGEGVLPGVRLGGEFVRSHRRTEGKFSVGIDVGRVVDWFLKN